MKPVSKSVAFAVTYPPIEPMPRSDLTTLHSGLAPARRDDFKTSIDGAAVDLYNLHVPGLAVQITNYGGRVVSLFAPDRNGVPGSVVLGFDTLDKYLHARERFHGAIIGRCANRIARGRFTLDGITYELSTNEGRHHLHGGVNGFDRAVWHAHQIDDRRLILTYSSRQFEEGYPGSVSARVTYRVTPDLALVIDYEATTDAPTIVNLTNHSYFNLAGPGSGPVSEHALQILADEYTPIDESLVPTGEIAPVDGTPLDFRTPRRIGERQGDDFEQLRFGRGYDHNWVLRTTSGPKRTAARVYEPISGRLMEVLTTEPGLQFYGGNFFDGSDIGTSGKPHRHREGFALETQHFPDSPNQPNFPSTVLRPGEVYRSQTTYRFYPGEATSG